jgi:pimeloyl-ACP methyl ester carboxylesterase
MENVDRYHQGGGAMPYTDNQGVRIHYQVDGAGLPLVLQHGFTQSLEDWYECGYVDALKTDYRLILIDARGHGGSDKPHDPSAYPLENRVSDVVAVLDALEVAKAHFWGYSMGGWIAFGMAEYSPERVARLVIGGQHPYARSHEGQRQILRIGIEQGSDAFLSSFEQMTGTLPAGYKRRLYGVDLPALLTAAQDRTSLEGVLAKIAMPCCLYAGEADPIFHEAKLASGRIPHAEFFSLPRLTHLPAFLRSDLVLPRVTAFLRSGER